MSIEKIVIQSIGNSPHFVCVGLRICTEVWALKKKVKIEICSWWNDSLGHENDVELRRWRELTQSNHGVFVCVYVCE